MDAAAGQRLDELVGKTGLDGVEDRRAELIEDHLEHRLANVGVGRALLVPTIQELRGNLMHRRDRLCANVTE